MWPNQTAAVQDGGDFEGGDEVTAATPVPLRAARVVFLSLFGLFTLCVNAGIVWYEQRAPSIQKTLVRSGLRILFGDFVVWEMQTFFKIHEMFSSAFPLFLR